VRCTGCAAEITRPRDWLLAIRAPDTGCERCDELDRLKVEFLTGQTIGGGSVLACIGRDRHDQHTWRVRCACGSEAARTTAHVRQTIRAGRIACRPCAQTREARAARREAIAALRHMPTRTGPALGDMVGAVNGRLRVTGYAEPHPLTGQTMLLVTCEVCGPKDKPMQVNNFHRARRCFGCQGMRNDLTGRKFGKLEVLDFAHSRDWKAYWQCRCECGVSVELSTNALTWDQQKSCGRCPHGRIDDMLRVRNRLILDYRNNAKRSGIEWALSADDAWLTMQQACWYCSAPPSSRVLNGKDRRNRTIEFVANGLRRVDRQRGFIPGNVIPCCRQCSRMQDLRRPQKK
jgi:hypothetical protein